MGSRPAAPACAPCKLQPVSTQPRYVKYHRIFRIPLARCSFHRRHRSLRAMARARAHPRWHHRNKKAHKTARTPVAGSGGRSPDSETHRGGTVSRSSRKSAQTVLRPLVPSRQVRARNTEPSTDRLIAGTVTASPGLLAANPVRCPTRLPVSSREAPMRTLPEACGSHRSVR